MINAFLLVICKIFLYLSQFPPPPPFRTHSISLCFSSHLRPHISHKHLPGIHPTHSLQLTRANLKSRRSTHVLPCASASTASGNNTLFCLWGLVLWVDHRRNRNRNLLSGTIRFGDLAPVFRFCLSLPSFLGQLPLHMPIRRTILEGSLSRPSLCDRS